MKVELTDVGVCEKRAEIHFEAADVKAEYDKYFDAYRKEFVLPGFRKGRAPAELVRRKFQKDIMKQVRESLEREGVRQMMKENVMRVVGEDEAEREGGEDETQAYTLRFTFQVAPNYKIPAYKGLEIEARAVEATDADVDAELDAIRRDHGRLEDAAEGEEVAEGDLVKVDYTGSIDGQAPGSVSEKAKAYDRREGFWTMARPGGSFLDGYCTELIGLKAGDRKTLSVDLGEAKAQELGLPKSTLDLEAEVKQIRKMRLPEIDDEFLKKVGVSDLDTLKKEIRERILWSKQRQEENRRRNAAVEALLAVAEPVEFSKKQTEQRVNADVYNIVSRLRAQRISADTIRQELPRIEEEARKNAVRKLTTAALLKTVCDAEQVVTLQNELQEALREAMDSSRAKSLGELATRMNVTEETIKEEMVRAIQERAAVNALLAYANWTGPEAEEASKAAKRHYRLTTARMIEGDAEWDSWKDL